MPDSDRPPKPEAAPANATAAGSYARPGGVTLEDLAAHLARKETQAHLDKLVRKIPFWWGTMREDARQDICVAALAAKKIPPTLEEVRAWIGGIANNVRADAFAEHYRRKRRTAQVDAETLAEIPEPEPEPKDERPKWMVDTWLRQQVAEDPPSAMTYWMLIDMGRNGRTYADLAVKHGTTEDAVKQRVHRLKEKYLDAWKKHKRARNSLAVLIVLVAAVILYVIARLLFPPPPRFEEIRPDNAVMRAPPAPTPTSFEPANPEPTVRRQNDKP
jgi:DNA-directed RNA polymerase specialized sigma24 family protein